MKHAIITKEQLLSAAVELAKTEGLASLNIRELAQKCAVSVGSIYNYFPDKDALLVAVIESFWRTAAHNMPKMALANDFRAFIIDLYVRFSAHLKSFREDWLRQMSAVSPSAKAAAREQEQFYFQHIIAGLCGIIDRDENIRKNAFNDKFTKEQFAAFVWDNLFILMRRGEKNCTSFIEVVNRCVY